MSEIGLAACSRAQRTLSRLLAAGLWVCASGCSLLSTTDDATGTYTFQNAYGYQEVIVVRPDFVEQLRFEVEGTLTLLDSDGQITGSGECTRRSQSSTQPGGEVVESEETRVAEVTGQRDGSRITTLRVTGCAFPRAMFGNLEKGRIVLDTDLDFPVSRGTTVISNRFGDPSTLELTRSE